MRYNKIKFASVAEEKVVKDGGEGGGGVKERKRQSWLAEGAPGCVRTRTGALDVRVSRGSERH